MKPNSIPDGTKFTIFDTETTGLFDFKQPAHLPFQPRLAHANIIYADAEGNALAAHDFIIKPDANWLPQHFADLESESNPNKLTREILERDGQPIELFLNTWTQSVKAGLIATAYNAQFDCKVVRAELRRDERDDMFEQTPNVCVMRPMTAICKLPKNRGGGFKFPKLAEALEFLGEKLENAHTAAADTEGARKVLQFLISQDALPEPQVHFARKGTNAGKALEARGGTPKGDAPKSEPLIDPVQSGEPIPDAF